MTKRSTLIAVLELFSLSITARDIPKEEGFVFITVKGNLIISIESQNRSSTCWSFPSLGFLENELLRMGKGEYDLSEIFVVHHTMIDRAQNYVCYYGGSFFSPGGSFYDITFCLKSYGPAPQEAMPGIMYGGTLSVYSESGVVAGAYTNAIAKGKLTKLPPVWKDGLSVIYDTYLGKRSEKFTYKGKEYTPKIFGGPLGINPDDYVSLTFYTHHPFYIQLAIEIQDNWCNGPSRNLPTDELMAVMNNAVRKGYTFAWGSDVSEQGFTRDGIVAMPNVARGVELTGSDMARWTGFIVVDEHKELTSKPLLEANATQEIRQVALDNWEATDDYGMVIYGITKGQNGKECSTAKDFWELSGKYKGIWCASKTLVAHKTMNILVYKGALPKDIVKKLGFK